MSLVCPLFQEDHADPALLWEGEDTSGEMTHTFRVQIREVPVVALGMGHKEPKPHSRSGR